MLSSVLALVVRRGLAQARLLVAVLAVVVAGSVLLGTCALLLTTGRDHAREAYLQQSPVDDVAVRVLIGDVPDDGGAAADAAAEVLTGTLAPLPAPVTTWATSSVRELGDGDRLGYLAGISDPSVHGELVTGRWPVAPTGPGPWEAVLPAAAAERLGVSAGDQLLLGGAASPAVAVRLVGTFAPDRGDPAWQDDPLAGAGYSPGLAFGVWQRAVRPGYGPFVVASEALLGPGGRAGELDQVRVVGHPDLAGASAAELRDLRARLGGARAALLVALTGQDAVARIDAPLSRTLARMDGQQAVTGSGVLVVALVGLALAGTALGLTARLVTGRRAAEAALLAARGAGRGRLVTLAAAEALVVAAVATLLAVPLSVLVYRGLTALPRLSAAGFGGPVGLPLPLVVTVLAGAVLLTAVLVVPALLPSAGSAAERTDRRGVLLRSGADLLLAGLTAVAFLQLRAHPGTAVRGLDPVLVAAPVLCLLAGALLALRVLPALQAAAERTARRSRGLLLPLAAWEVARRRHATGAAFLLVLATAAATFGAGYSSTWSTSQASQAAARVGADLTVPATGVAPLGAGAVVAAATGGTVSPATVRPIALGAAVTGDLPRATRLVAVDTTRAGELLSGRPSGGRTWAAATTGLRPDEPARGTTLTVPAAGAAVTVSGSSVDGVLAAQPVLVVRDGQGGRSTLTGDPVLLDGGSHPVALRDTAGDAPAAGTEVTVVGAELRLDLLDDAGIDPAVERSTAVTVQVQLAGAPAATSAAWTARAPVDAATLLQDTGASLIGGALAVTGRVSLRGLLVEDARLLVTAYRPPDRVPVLLSQDLADALGAEEDGGIALGLGAETVTGVVAGVVPVVPGAADGPGVLADVEVLGRALAAHGDLEPVTDAWWAGGVADPAGSVDRLVDAGLPGARTRAEVAAQLRDGPLRVGLPTALWLLVAAAAALALTGTAVHTAAALDSRSVEVARLQGLGVPRRSVAAAVLLEHTLVTTVAVLLGAATGALACRFLAPLMTVSETGDVPVPAPVAQWPWPVETLVVAGLLLGCAAVVVPVVASSVRRAGAAHLRLGEAS